MVITPPLISEKCQARDNVLPSTEEVLTVIDSLLEWDLWEIIRFLEMRNEMLIDRGRY